MSRKRKMAQKTVKDKAYVKEKKKKRRRRRRRTTTTTRRHIIARVQMNSRYFCLFEHFNFQASFLFFYMVFACKNRFYIL